MLNHFAAHLHAASLSKTHRARRLVVLGAVACVAGSFITACGGGGSGYSQPNPPPQAARSVYTEGTISGFGSIIVGGVRFDDSGATVVDDDGARHGLDDLKLGMSVSIDSGEVSNGSAVANEVRFSSEIVGPISSVGANSLVVLGQTIVVNGATVFDDSLPGGLAALGAADVVEVYALFDASSGRYIATRVEDKNNAKEYRLRGVVAGLDAGAKTFRIGSETISYANARDLPAGLDNGQTVRVRLQTVAVGGVWQATRVQSGREDTKDHDEAEVKGTITEFTSATQFSVNGLPVDATNAQFRDGTGGVALGAVVEVEGAIRGGVLVAKSVHLEDSEDLDIELHGSVGSLNAQAQTFVLRGVTVDYSAVVTWERGSEANLADGVQLEVEGTLSGDGTRMVASKVKFED